MRGDASRGIASGPRSRAAEVTRILEAAIAPKSAYPARAAAFDVLAKKLPTGVPTKLVERFWATRMRHPCVYYRLKGLPDEYAGAVIAGLRAWKAPAAVFLTKAIEDAPSAASLRAANQAFFELDAAPEPYSPRGKKRILAAIADPRYLAAMRAAVAAHGFGDDAFMFARAAIYEAGDASVDALRPWALASKGAERARLRGLADYASTTAMRALLEGLGPPPVHAKRSRRALVREARDAEGEATRARVVAKRPS